MQVLPAIAKLPRDIAHHIASRFTVYIIKLRSIISEIKIRYITLPIIIKDAINNTMQ